MKKILSILLALTMLLSVTALTGTTAAAADNKEPVNPVGVYKLAELNSGSGSNLAIISSIVNMGVDFFLTVREDGTGSMEFLETKVPLEWDNDRIVFRAGKGDAFPGQVKVPYICENDTLTITTQAYSMKFRATSEEERADYEANGAGSLVGLAGRVAQNLIRRMDGGLVEGLLFDLALGMLDSKEPEPIPEGEPSKESGAGTVKGMEFTVLGADSVQYKGVDYIVLFFDAANRSDIRALLLLLSPFAPHIAEELWELQGFEGMACETPWPAFDESKMVDETKTIAVQVNGKLRSTVTVPADADADTMRAAALADRKIAGYVEGMEIVKTIAVPNKLINLILKPKK